MSTRPQNCRNRLRDEGQPYPKSGCEHCKTGGMTGCPFERSAAADATTQVPRVALNLHDAHAIERASAVSEAEWPTPSVLRLTITRKIGSYGAAYDGPHDARAYTYKHSPSNQPAWEIGRAATRAAKSPGGDYIDAGLQLLHQLEQEGFGIFALVEGEVTETAPPPARPGDWTVTDSQTARAILNYLSIGDDASLEPGADRRRDNVASIICTARETSATAEKSAAEHDVLTERRRQIEAEGWTAEHDDRHHGSELADAADCYIRFGAGSRRLFKFAPPDWPWAFSWWKPKDRRRDLVRAGALIIAEIERLDRAAAPNGVGGANG